MQSPTTLSCTIRLAAAADRSAGRPHGSVSARIIRSRMPLGIRARSRRLRTHCTNSVRVSMLSSIASACRTRSSASRARASATPSSNVRLMTPSASYSFPCRSSALAEIEIGIGQSRIGADRLLEMRDGVRGAPHAASAARRAHYAPARDRPSATARARSRPRPRRAALPGMKLGEPEVRFGGARLELQHAGVAAGRRRQVAGVAQRVAEMEMRLGEIRLEPDRAPQMRDRVLVRGRARAARARCCSGSADLSVRARSPCRSGRRRLRCVRSDAPARRDNAGSARASDRSRAPGDNAGRHRRTVRPDDAGRAVANSCATGDHGAARRPLVLPAQDGVPVIGRQLSAKRTVRRNRYTATASLARSARLRSFGSSSRLRRRIDFGVTSTSSSSPI